MTRSQTDVDRVADSYLDETAALNPLAATYWGIAGHDGEMPDLSPDGLEQSSELRRRTLNGLEGVEAVDANDRITVAALREELELAEQIRATGAEESSLNNIDSPLQSLRDVFDLMAADTADDWTVIATRLGKLPAAMDGYVESLRLAASRGRISAARQVRAGITQAEKAASADGSFAQLVTSAPPELPASIRAEVERNARAAAEAYTKLGRILADELLPHAPEPDAVGREEYVLHSRAFLGAVVDLEETYDWGQRELARLTAKMDETAERILPGASLQEAKDHLDHDPARMLGSREELVAWMQRKSDEAVASLTGTHFDIPEPVRRLDCRIAPAGTGVIYYTGPSEDFSRPGQMWWSVPEGDDEFSTWRELTTVYHEGVPGHHLQVGQTAYRSELLNRWRRLASWVSGHGEGWALYAELLMADLGYLDDPGEYLGMLNGQAMRAARVVIDIGVHCGLTAPAEVGGGAWTYDKAWELLGAHCAMGESVRRFELERYMGWPGQAPSYKIGERLWLQLREDVRRQEGDSFDLASFHRRALDIGSVGLDVLRQAVLGHFD
jgi:uncharacterized protein (DUF885 family)